MVQLSSINCKTQKEKIDENEIISRIHKNLHLGENLLNYKFEQLCIIVIMHN